MTDTTALCVLLLTAVLGRFIAPRRLTLSATRALASRWFPVLVSLVSAALLTWLWGGLDPVATIHDEAAYLLQAKMYAQGHWTEMGRPLPEFFEQYHVFVTPILTSKYPPGHAFFLVPGIWLGLPALMPILLMGACGGLVFIVARRLTNPWIGLITWMFWLTAPGVMEFEPGFMSETTTGALWMLGWYALLRWTEDDRQQWLAILALCIGAGFLARPVTMVLYAIPIAALVLVRIAKKGSWRQLRIPIGIATVCLGIWALWSQRTTGNPLHAPYGLYSRYYFPDDVMGFGLTGLQPLRPLNADMTFFNETLKTQHREYTFGHLPQALASRLVAISANMWATRAMFLPLAAIGLLTANPVVWFAVLSAVLLVLGYLCVGHHPLWTVYYIEIQPVLAFLTALAWWRLVSVVGNRRFSWPKDTFAITPGAVFGLLVGVIVLMPYIAGYVPHFAESNRDSQAYQRDFRELLKLLPDARSMVFVRYAPKHNPFNSLVTNEPDLDRARVWKVHDRGADNIRLLRLDPSRTPWLFDDEHRVLVMLDSTGALIPERTIREPGKRP
jgi:dolichyl-phosphate-mannose-protein mannosyltransferase